MDLKKLKEVVNKLKALLDDPQPGMLSWNMFLQERCEEFTKMYEEAKRGKVYEETSLDS